MCVSAHNVRETLRTVTRLLSYYLMIHNSRSNITSLAVHGVHADLRIITTRGERVSSRQFAESQSMNHRKNFIHKTEPKPVCVCVFMDIHEIGMYHLKT